MRPVTLWLYYYDDYYYITVPTLTTCSFCFSLTLLSKFAKFKKMIVLHNEEHHFINIKMVRTPTQGTEINIPKLNISNYQQNKDFF